MKYMTSIITNLKNLPETLKDFAYGIKLRGPKRTELWHDKDFDVLSMCFQNWRIEDVEKWDTYVTLVFQEIFRCEIPEYLFLQWVIPLK